jgi:hypothetical protein
MIIGILWNPYIFLCHHTLYFHYLFDYLSLLKHLTANIPNMSTTPIDSLKLSE